MKIIILVSVVLLFSMQFFAQNTGYEVLRITDELRQRPIQIDVWYPTTASEKKYNYGLSKGNVANKANILAKKFPLVLFSHGAMGAAANYSWITEYLARQGFIVVGVSHFGESPVFGLNSIDPTSASRFGDRTKDLNFALDFIVERSKFSANIDTTRIGAIGHSSGGTSVLMINGAIFSPEKIVEYCQNSRSGDDKGCSYPRSTEIDKQRFLPTKSTRSFKAIVALDPAVGQGFTKDGLKTIVTPTLIIGSVKNDFLPFEFHAGYFAKQIKNAKLVKLNNGEGHFVYIDECNLPIKVMGISLCTDRNGVDRKTVHSKLSVIIGDFLKQKLR